jgi:hypothetical protein
MSIIDIRSISKKEQRAPCGDIMQRYDARTHGPEKQQHEEARCIQPDCLVRPECHAGTRGRTEPYLCAATGRILQGRLVGDEPQFLHGLHTGRDGRRRRGGHTRRQAAAHHADGRRHHESRAAREEIQAPCIKPGTGLEDIFHIFRAKLVFGTWDETDNSAVIIHRLLVAAYPCEAE